MNQVTLDDVKLPEEYEPLREAMRQRVIEMKKRRRLAVGDSVTFVFENRDTVLFQIQEMVRAEKITSPEAIQDEIDVYNKSIPASRELSATMFIELTEKESMRADLDRLVGVNEKVALRIGDEHVIPGVFEPGWSREDRVAAVQYVKFPLTAEQAAAFRAGSAPAVVEIDHPNYRARTEMPDDVRRELAADLTAS